MLSGAEGAKLSHMRLPRSAALGDVDGSSQSKRAKRYHSLRKRAGATEQEPETAMMHRMCGGKAALVPTVARLWSATWLLQTQPGGVCSVPWWQSYGAQCPPSGGVQP